MEPFVDLPALDLWPYASRQILQEKNLNPEQLGKEFSSILFPWSSDYDKQRLLFRLQIQERPLFIIFPNSNAELKKILDLCTDYKLKMRIVSGRHSTNLINPDVFISLSNLKKIKVMETSDGAFLTVGPGWTQGQILDYLSNNYPHLCLPSLKNSYPSSSFATTGNTASVGISGIMTVGGIVLLKRLYGLMIDSVVEFKIATPPNRKEHSLVRTANADRNQSLFWAVRGGLGSNFGIISEITFKLYKVGDVISYTLDVDWEKMVPFLNLWTQESPKKDKRYSEEVTIVSGSSPLYHNDPQPVLKMSGYYVLADGERIYEAKEKVINSLRIYRSFGIQIAVNEGPYNQVINSTLSSRRYHPFALQKGYFSSDLNEKAFQLLKEQIEKATAIQGNQSILIEALGGAVRDVHPKETAFYYREASFFSVIGTAYDSNLDELPNENWNHQTADQFQELTKSGVYVGFQQPHLQNHLQLYYGENVKKLQQIKKQYDPFGIMNVPQGL